MRVNLYWRGRDVIDVELHVWKRRADDDKTEEPPKLQAAAHPVDVSRAEPMSCPDTTVSIGFGRPA